MKRMLALLMCMPLMLCGCSTQENEITPTEQVSTTSAQTEKVYLNEVRTIEYQTIHEFLESEFCQTMQSEGFAVYLPSYDAAQYELRRITSDAAFYEFSFVETATGKYVVYGVLYRTCFKSADEFAQLYPDTADENILTSVEKDSVLQDAYIVKTQLTEDSCCYNLSYLPMEGYEVYIGSNSSTPEDALAYIHDFDLVPADEWQSHA